MESYISKFVYAGAVPELSLCYGKRTLQEARGLEALGKSLSTYRCLHQIRASNQCISGEFPTQKNNPPT